MRVNHHPATAPARPPPTEAALCAWVGHAVPGDRFVYHLGFLAIDLAPDSRSITPEQRRVTRALAARAWKLAQQGLVHLVQRRETAGEFTYFAVARSRPRAAGTTLHSVLEQAGLSDPTTPARRSA